MFYQCVEMEVEERDREDVRRMLVEIFRRFSPFWRERFERLRGTRSLLLKPGNKYVVISSHLDYLDSFIVLGKIDVGEVKVLYPIVLNWDYIKRACKSLDDYEKVQSAIFVGLGKIVLPVEGRKVIAVFDWSEKISQSISVLRELIESCFEYDIREDEKNILGFFDDKKDPILFYLENRLKGSVLQAIQDVYFNYDERENWENVHVKWGYDVDIYVNVKGIVNEADRGVLESFNLLEKEAKRKWGVIKKLSEEVKKTVNNKSKK